MDETDYLRAKWTFESRVTQPNGITVTCTITVPRSAEWSDVGEINEVAQMCAGRASAAVLTNKTRADEKVPF